MSRATSPISEPHLPAQTQGQRWLKYGGNVILTCVVLIALGGAVAYWLIRRVTGMKLTRKTVMDDIGMLRKAADSGPNGSGPAVKNPEVGTGAGAKAQIPPAGS